MPWAGAPCRSWLVPSLAPPSQPFGDHGLCHPQTRVQITTPSLHQSQLGASLSRSLRPSNTHLAPTRGWGHTGRNAGLLHSSYSERVIEAHAWGVLGPSAHGYHLTRVLLAVSSVFCPHTRPSVPRAEGPHLALPPGPQSPALHRAHSGHAVSRSLTSLGIYCDSFPSATVPTEEET